MLRADLSSEDTDELMLIASAAEGAMFMVGVC